MSTRLCPADLVDPDWMALASSRKRLTFYEAQQSDGPQRPVLSEGTSRSEIVQGCQKSHFSRLYMTRIQSVQVIA